MPANTIHTDSLLNADTVEISADLLREFPSDGGGMFAADSVVMAVEQPDSLVQIAVSAGEMFGANSLASYGTAEQLPAIVTDAAGLPYQVMALCLALFYFFVVMTQRAEIVQSLGTLFGKRHDDRNTVSSYSYGRTMKILVVMSAFTYGIAVVRGLHASGIVVTAYSSWSAPIVVLAVTAAILLINEFQQLVLKLAGALTFENKFVTSLLSMRRAFAAIIGLTITPVVFLFALTGDSWAFVGFCIALTMLSIFILGYMCYSFKFFVDEKVSILVWFLYLCAVEVVPYGILILGILRTA